MALVFTPRKRARSEGHRTSSFGEERESTPKGAGQRSPQGRGYILMREKEKKKWEKKKCPRPLWPEKEALRELEERACQKRKREKGTIRISFEVRPTEKKNLRRTVSPP